ncbi:MAG: hypothetical protein IPO14_04545 [Saprospiraceae bacterium]|nr:hypothetical protein [Saprospiraceae bacterium]
MVPTVGEPTLPYHCERDECRCTMQWGMTGSIDANGKRRAGAVTYVWSDGATTEDRSGLAAGTYSVTATDAVGCVATTSIAISEDKSLVVSALDQTIACGSADATLTASGGTSYAWSTGSPQPK